MALTLYELAAGERRFSPYCWRVRMALAAKGLTGARIDEIAELTRTSKRMIYYYFGSKEGLYIAVLEEAYRRILEHEDPVAADNFVQTFAGGDTKSWRGHSRAQWVIGGNVHLVGTPEQIVEGFLKLQAAGCDGLDVSS